jgi:hypothetical protein
MNPADLLMMALLDYDDLDTIVDGSAMGAVYADAARPPLDVPPPAPSGELPADC